MCCEAEQCLLRVLASTPTCKAALKEAVWQLPFLFHQVCFLRLLLLFFYLLLFHSWGCKREGGGSLGGSVYWEALTVGCGRRGKAEQGNGEEVDPCSDVQFIVVLHQQWPKLLVWCVPKGLLTCMFKISSVLSRKLRRTADILFILCMFWLLQCCTCALLTPTWRKMLDWLVCVRAGCVIWNKQSFPSLWSLNFKLITVLWSLSRQSASFVPLLYKRALLLPSCRNFSLVSSVRDGASCGSVPINLKGTVAHFVYPVWFVCLFPEGRGKQADYFVLKNIYSILIM